MIAAIRVRGQVDVSEKIKATLESLGLEKRNQCVLVDEENEAVKGMLKKAKDYITYGVVDEDVLEQEFGDVEPGQVISLSPPSGGFKDTKKNVNEGGALGKRKNMTELFQKMV